MFLNYWLRKFLAAMTMDLRIGFTYWLLTPSVVQIFVSTCLNQYMLTWVNQIVLCTSSSELRPLLTPSHQNHGCLEIAMEFGGSMLHLCLGRFLKAHGVVHWPRRGTIYQSIYSSQINPLIWKQVLETSKQCVELWTFGSLSAFAVAQDLSIASTSNCTDEDWVEFCTSLVSDDVW